jgi:hypothetical protein
VAAVVVDGLDIALLLELAELVVAVTVLLLVVALEVQVLPIEAVEVEEQAAHLV